jgi:hypothetical protein
MLGRKLGFDYKVKLHSGPDWYMHMTVVSSRLFPVVNEAGEPTYVLGPLPGRVITKFGKYVATLDKADKVMSYLKADCIGRRRDLQFIPFVRKLVERIEQLTANISTTDMTPDMRRSFFHNNHTNQRFQATTDTFTMMQHLYGLTEDDEREYASELAKVTSLPWLLNYPKFGHMMMVDDVDPKSSGYPEHVPTHDDGWNTMPPADECKLPSPGPIVSQMLLSMECYDQPCDLETYWFTGGPCDHDPPPPIIDDVGVAAAMMANL